MGKKEKEICEMYISGMTTRQVGEATGVSSSTVSRVLKKCNITCRHIINHELLDNKVISLYLSGLTACQVAEEVGLSNVNISDILKRNNVETRNNITHGMTNIAEYGVFYGMKDRCYNTNSHAYERYGGRGIKVEWETFEEFYKDMGPRPSPDHSIDRIDNDGNYCKENCRWATCKEQSSNRRSNVNITINGMTKTLKEWSCHYGINYGSVYSRISRGMSIEEALTKPLKNNQGEAVN